MTLNTILKRLNQSTPFDESQFTEFLKDLMGWMDFKLERNNLPVALHESIGEYSRRYTSKQPNLIIWVIKFKQRNNSPEDELLEFISTKDPNCIVVIRYPDEQTWKFGTLRTIESQIQFEWMNIGDEFTNHTWAQLIFNHLNSEEKSLQTFYTHFQRKNLHGILTNRLKQWLRFVRNTLAHSSPPLPSDTPFDIPNTLFLQTFVLKIIEAKGWLRVSQKEDWGKGSRTFLLDEWRRIQSRGENFWLTILRPLLFELSNQSTGTIRYTDSRFINVNLKILQKAHITDNPIPNDFFWDPNVGLLSILYAFPISLESKRNHCFHLNEHDLRSVLEWSISRGDNNEYKSYFTPSIVANIVSTQAIETYILNQLQKTIESGTMNSTMVKEVSKWIQTGQISEEIQSHAHILTRWLQTCLVCDPAVGTGALLVSMLQQITTLSCQLDASLKPHKVKYTLLQHSLFGVDSNPLSLMVTNISLWLCWVAERQDPKIFPNLEGNIIHANSIIDEPFHQPLVKEESLAIQLIPSNLSSAFGSAIIDLRNGLMHDLKSYPLSDQPSLRLQEILDKQWKLSLLHAQTALRPADIQQLKERPEEICVWQWRFPKAYIRENPGFDIVVCNPPFMNEETGRTFFRDLQYTSSLKKYFGGRMDLLYYFIHRCLEITNSGGSIGLITNDFWTKASGAQRLREHLQSHTHLSHWLHFGEFNDLEIASRQHNLITCFAKVAPKTEDHTKVCNADFKRNTLQWLEQHRVIDYATLPTKDLYHSPNSTMQFVNQAQWGVFLEKLEQRHPLLKEVASIHQGLVTGLNQHSIDDTDDKHGIFVLDDGIEYDRRLLQQLRLEDPTLLQPLQKNSEIQAFSVDHTTKRYVLYLHRELDISEKSHPTLWNHLEPFKEKLIQRRERGEHDWWCLSWPRNPEIFVTNAIVTPYRSTSFRFARNHTGAYFSSDCTMIVPDESKLHPSYLLGYLNSTVFECWYRLKGKNKGTLLEFLAGPLQEVPVPICSEEACYSIVKIVEEIEEKTTESGPPVLLGYQKAIDTILFRELTLSLSEQRQIYKYVNLFK